MPEDTTNSLITIHDLKPFIGVAESDDDYDDLLYQAIDAASWYLNSETHRKLKARALTEYYDGRGTDKLILDQRPINTITSIYSDPDRSFGTATLVDSDDYQIYGDEGYIIFTDTAVDVGHRVLKVTYNAGFSTIPYDLKQACIEIAAKTYHMYRNNRVGMKSVTSDAGTQSYDQEDSPFVKKIIQKYMAYWVL